MCHRQVEHVGPTSLKTDPAFAPLSDQVVTRVGEVQELQLPAKVQPMPESTGPCSSLTLCGIHIASHSGKTGAVFVSLLFVWSMAWMPYCGARARGNLLVP